MARSTVPSAQQPPVLDLEEYSASSTLVQFSHPIPLLRGPIKASPEDDPTFGAYLLAFRDPQSWASAYASCETQITQQCEYGARIGCSTSASNKCKTPWYKTLFGSPLRPEDYVQRAKCEECEMEACFEAAKEKCAEFAKQKCLLAFRDARVKVNRVHLKRKNPEVSRLISWVCFASSKGVRADFFNVTNSLGEIKSQFEEVTIIRGSDLLDPSNGMEFIS